MTTPSSAPGARSALRLLPSNAPEVERTSIPNLADVRALNDRALELSEMAWGLLHTLAKRLPSISQERATTLVRALALTEAEIHLVREQIGAALREHFTPEEHDGPR